MPRFKQGRDDRNIGTTLRIPNNDEGLAFIRQLRKYRTTGVRVRVRARGPRVKWAPVVNRTKRAVRQDLPKQFAEYFAVYVDKVTPKEIQARREQSEEYWRLWEAANKIPQLEAQMAQLAREVKQKKIFDVPDLFAPVRRKFKFDA